MNNKIKSWQMLAPGKPIKMVEKTFPKLSENEILIKISGCGVCHTDLGFFYGNVRTKSNLPLTLGHEISGVIIDSGSKEKKNIGKAIIIPSVISCGTCDLCKRNLGNICPNQKMPGNDIDGGFASHIVVPNIGMCYIPTDNDLKPIGEAETSLEELSVVADAITTPYQAIIDSNLTYKDVAIFIGVGGIGGFGAQIAKSFGSYVIAIDIDNKKLNSIEPYVDITFNSNNLDYKKLKKEIANFVKINKYKQTEWKIFETSGTEKGQLLAFSLLTFGSYLSVVGYTMDKINIRLSNLMAFHAVASGNWGCLSNYYSDVMKLVLDGQVKIGPFVEFRKLSEINSVFEEVHNKEIDKRIILINN